MYRNAARKAKAELELETMREVKDNKKCFCKYIGSLKEG